MILTPSTAFEPQSPSTGQTAPTAGSQTVGPFFRIGLEYMYSHFPESSPGELEPGVLKDDEIEVRGRLLDAQGQGIPDALLEFWGADAGGAYDTADSIAEDGRPRGFIRLNTGLQGEFHLVMRAPGPVVFAKDRMQSPHIVVLVFMRGLLRHLITRMYLPGQPGLDSDPVLSLVPADRRHTLIARNSPRHSRSLDWEIRMQGGEETVFFAW